jgi:hypothetical protein
MGATDAAVERAFQEWCAMMGVSARAPGVPGSFRLARDGSGTVLIEQVGEGGEVRAVAPGMPPREFCAAVHFVHESMNIKTVQVARSIARQRRRR